MRIAWVVLGLGFLGGCQSGPSGAFLGTDLPETLKPSDLDASFTAVKIAEQDKAGRDDYYAATSSSLNRLGVRVSSDSSVSKLVELMQVAWVKDGTVAKFDQTFIATYIFEPSIETLKSIADGKPLVDPVLKLKLRKADQIASMEPFPDVTRESYVAGLAEFGPDSELWPTIAAEKGIANAELVARAFMLYAGDHDGVYPYATGITTVQRITLPYMTNLDAWKTHNSRGKGEFRYNLSIGGTAAVRGAAASETPLIFDPTPFPDGRYLVGFANRSARFLTPEEWEAMQPMFNLALPRVGRPID